MTNIPITLTCSDYARVMLLTTGEIKADGIDLALVTSKPASWDDRQEMMRRAMHDPAVHGGEASMAGQLRRIEQGDRRYIALPVFRAAQLRGARSLCAQRRCSIKRPDDLNGKRIGMFNWVASGTVWYRHFLRSVGVNPESIEWWIGDVDTPSVSEHVVTLPPGVHAPASGGFSVRLLLAGEIDAIFNPQKPKRYHPTTRTDRAPFRDMRSVDRAYSQCYRRLSARSILSSYGVTSGSRTSGSRGASRTPSRAAASCSTRRHAPFPRTYRLGSILIWKRP